MWINFNHNYEVLRKCIVFLNAYSYKEKNSKALNCCWFINWRRNKIQCTHARKKLPLVMCYISLWKQYLYGNIYFCWSANTFLLFLAVSWLDKLLLYLSGLYKKNKALIRILSRTTTTAKTKNIDRIQILFEEKYYYRN